MTKPKTWEDPAHSLDAGWPPYQSPIMELVAGARAVDWDFTTWCYASGHDADKDARLGAQQKNCTCGLSESFMRGRHPVRIAKTRSGSRTNAAGSAPTMNLIGTCATNRVTDQRSQKMKGRTSWIGLLIACSIGAYSGAAAAQPAGPLPTPTDK
jgi:hypothetical protein